MKIRYDPDVDAMYIKLREAEVAETKKINDYIILDCDEEGNVIGIELLFVKEHNPNILREFQVENLVPL